MRRLCPRRRALLALPLLAGCTDNTPSAADGASGRPAGGHRRGHRRPRARLRPPTAPVGKADLHRHQQGLPGHRVLPAGRGRPAHRRRGREHRPRPVPRPRAHRPPGAYFTACKPGMVGDGIRAAVHRHRLRRGHQRRRQRRSELVDRRDSQVRRLRQGPDRAAAHQDQEFADAYKAGDDDKARALYPVARSTGSASSRWRSRSATSTPRWTCARPTSSPASEWTGWHRIEKDLWPRAGQGLQAADDAASARPTPTTWSPTPRAATTAPAPHLHRRPDRQRRPRPARRGRDRQGHRRGGVLVAHRPVGLPGQRRRRPRRLRGPPSDPAGARPRARRRSSTPRFTALQTLLDQQRVGRRLHALRPTSASPTSRRSPTRSTRWPSPCPSSPPRSS